MVVQDSRVKVAFATDDGVNLSTEHFGSAKEFLVYYLDLLQNKWILDRVIENTTAEEEFHGDPNKARSIHQLLHDVQVFVGFAMGLNIKRMRNYILPIVARIKNIEEVKEALLLHIDNIVKHVNDEIKPIMILDTNKELKIIQ